MTKPTPPNQLRAAIYTRKSTTIGLDDAFNSLDAQAEACAAYIANQPNWTAVPTKYEDGGYTGANTSRPGFQRLMADVKAKRIDVVVVYKVDRLSRSLLDFVSLLDTFNKAGVSFVSITQNFSTADAMGRLTLNILATFAQFEREMIGERTRDKVGAARRKGKWTGGTVPIGYRVVDKKLVIDEDEAPIVREAFKHYLETRSSLSVVQHLNDSGYSTKQHVSAHGKVRDSHAWDKGDVLRVLKNPLYAGLIRGRDELYPGEHEPIIARDSYDQAQAMLASSATTHNDPGTPSIAAARNPAYILAGLLKCPNCGYAYTTAGTVNHGRQYRYYRAVSQLKRGGQACSCGHISAEALEHYVIGRIREACIGGNLGQAVAALAGEKLAARREALSQERRELSQSIRTMAAKARRLERLVKTVYGDERVAIKVELDDVRERLDASQARLDRIPVALAELESIRIESEWVAQVINDFDAVWEVLIPINRVRLVHALVREVTFDGATKQIRMVMRSMVEDESDESEAKAVDGDAVALDEATRRVSRAMSRSEDRAA